MKLQVGTANILKKRNRVVSTIRIFIFKVYARIQSTLGHGEVAGTICERAEANHQAWIAFYS